MTRIAADPHELTRAADDLREGALEYAAIVARLREPLPSMPYDVASGVHGGLASVAADVARLTEVTIDRAKDLTVVAYWFELAGADEMDPLGALLRPLAVTQLDDALGWLARSDDAAPLSALTLGDWLGIDTGTASITEIADSFSGLSTAQTSFLLQQYPDAVGSLDGAPLRARFAANRILIERTVAALEADAETLRSKIATLQSHLNSALAPLPPGTRVGAQTFLELGALTERLEIVQSRLAALAPMADPGQNFLLFDPTGDGRAAEVLGDLHDAAHVAVLVPGMNTELADFAGFRANADYVRAQALRFGNGDVATIAWLGYDTPTVRDVAFSGDAERGAVLLDRFVDGLRQHVTPHVTAIGHSYGGAVTGTSLRLDLDVEDAIFVGAPGTGAGVDDASELRTSAELWAAKNDLPQEFVPSLPAHGEDPTEEGFGATRFYTNASGRPQIEGHSSYFQPNSESLYNIGAIVSDEDDLVSLY